MLPRERGNRVRLLAYVNAEDVVSMVLFIAPNDTRFTTAEIINLHGGAAAKL